MLTSSIPHKQLALRFMALLCGVLVLPVLACTAGEAGSSTKKITHHKFLVLLCKADDVKGDPPRPQKYYKQLFTDKTPNVRNVYNYFVDESYGSADIDGTVVTDWNATPYVQSPSATTDPSKVLPIHDRHGLAQACADSYKSAFNFSDFESGGIITIWNFDVDGGLDDGATCIGPCDPGAGIVEDGVNYGYVNGRWYRAVSFFTHEMLHVLGVDHARGPFPFDHPELASTYIDAGNMHTFGANAFAEYGDCWTIMGCGIMTNDFRGPFGEYGPDLGAYQRDYLGWMPGDRVLLWDNGHTTKVSLAPANRPDVAGTMLVKIPLEPSLTPSATGPYYGMYTVEYIERYGWSAGIGLEHAVLIHEIRPNDRVHTYLVSRTLFGAWLPGQVFLDSKAHVRISVDSYGPTASITLSSTMSPDDGTTICTPGVTFHDPYATDTDVTDPLPMVTVLSPLPDTKVIAGMPVTFQVQALDPTRPVPLGLESIPDSRISWSFSDGSPSGPGSSLVHKFASSGDTTIQVTAVGRYCGVTTQTFTLHVDPLPTSPTVSIYQPVAGQEYPVSGPEYTATVALAGAGSSDIVSFDWIDETTNKALGSGDRISAPIKMTSAGTTCAESHTILLRGKTSGGQVAEARITIWLKPDCIR